MLHYLLPVFHRDLRQFEAMVAQVMAARPTESHRKMRRSQETKPGSPAYDRKLKKAALDNLSESGEKDWKVMWFFIYIMINVDTAPELYPRFFPLHDPTNTDQPFRGLSTSG